MSVTIVCVNQGNYGGCGKQYVETLYDMIKRNASAEFKFICFTDDQGSYNPEIEKRSLPSECKGWFSKLYLFSQPFEGQVFFFDLDTVITSEIDDILSYRGEFCILRDFYRPEGFGSGLMSWHGDYTRIWDKFKQEGYPDIVGGDQIWIEKFLDNPDRWQDLYRGVYSYKLSCERWPPADAKIICFHGVPRPHEINGSWVPLVWKIGGPKNITKNNDVMNVTVDDCVRNMTENCKRELDWLLPHPANTKTLCIVGGAPSLKDNLGELRAKMRLGAHVMTTNGSLKYLTSKGIKPFYHAQFDARRENDSFVKDAPDGVTYLIGSMSNPSVLDALEGKDVILWHGGFDLEAQLKILQPYQNKPIVVVGGASTIGLRAMSLGYQMGYRKFILFGVDSSFHKTEHHAYPQALNDMDGYINILYDGVSYQCAPWMYRQALDFERNYKELTDLGCTIKVIGKGLIPDMCAYLNGESECSQKAR